MKERYYKLQIISKLIYQYNRQWRCYSYISRKIHDDYVLYKKNQSFVDSLNEK